MIEYLFIVENLIIAACFIWLGVFGIPRDNVNLNVTQTRAILFLIAMSIRDVYVFGAAAANDGYVDVFSPIPITLFVIQTICFFAFLLSFRSELKRVQTHLILNHRVANAIKELEGIRKRWGDK